MCTCTLNSVKSLYVQCKSNGGWNSSVRIVRVTLHTIALSLKITRTTQNILWISCNLCRLLIVSWMIKPNHVWNHCNPCHSLVMTWMLTPNLLSTPFTYCRINNNTKSCNTKSNDLTTIKWYVPNTVLTLHSHAGSRSLEHVFMPSLPFS